jgi:ABC-type glycerol-3-phosphate transport system permease component
MLARDSESAKRVAVPRRAFVQALGSLSLRRAIASVAFLICALLLAAFFTVPLLYALSTSLKPVREVLAYPPKWIPSTIRWDNYVYALTEAPFLRFIRNTAVVTLAAVFGQVLSSAVVAYGFARFRFPGRDVLFFVLIATMIFPVEAIIVPRFLLFKFFGWLNSWKPLIVPNYFGVAFSIFVLRQFFLTLPRDLEEAALVDGAGSLRVFWSIVLPLSKPALATVTVLAFVWHWNRFLEPLIYLDTPEKFTISLGLRFYQRAAISGQQASEHLLMAAAMIVSIPCIVLFVALQRYFVKGVVTTGLKL